MAEPQDRPDEGSGAIPPVPQQKAAPKKAPRKAPGKAPRKAPGKAPGKAPAKAAGEATAKKAPTGAAKKAPPKVALEPRVSAAPPKPADGAAVTEVPATEVPAAPLSGDTAPPGAAPPGAAPPARPAHHSGRARIPVAIGLAAASLVTMVIRRLRRG